MKYFIDGKGYDLVNKTGREVKIRSQSPAGAERIVALPSDGTTLFPAEETAPRRLRTDVSFTGDDDTMYVVPSFLANERRSAYDHSAFDVFYVVTREDARAVFEELILRELEDGDRVGGLSGLKLLVPEEPQQTPSGTVYGRLIWYYSPRTVI